MKKKKKEESKSGMRNKNAGKINTEKKPGDVTTKTQTENISLHREKKIRFIQKTWKVSFFILFGLFFKYILSYTRPHTKVTAIRDAEPRSHRLRCSPQTQLRGEPARTLQQPPRVRERVSTLRKRRMLPVSTLLRNIVCLSSFQWTQCVCRYYVLRSTGVFGYSFF